MAFASLNIAGYENPTKYQDHQRLLVQAVMRCEDRTLAQMATYLGIDERSLKQFLNGYSIMSVEARVSRWMSVPVADWNAEMI